jgi:hypothetical protein
MLSTLELVIYGFISLVLFPIIVQQLLTGSPPPSGGPLRKYYIAQPYLNLSGNLMVLGICALAIVRLVQHFGYIDADLGTRLSGWIEVPIMGFLLAFLALWVIAILKVRRRGTGA